MKFTAISLTAAAVAVYAAANLVSRLADVGNRQTCMSEPARSSIETTLCFEGGFANIHANEIAAGVFVKSKPIEDTLTSNASAYFRIITGATQRAIGTDTSVLPSDTLLEERRTSELSSSISTNFSRAVDDVDVPDKSDVTLSHLPSTSSASGLRRLPLIISPKKDSSLSFLKDFLFHNKGWLDEQLKNCGAVLLRGFELDSATKVESAVQSFEANLNNEYRGTSPRTAQEGTQFVFSAAEVPSHYPIAQHLEMSFLPAPPRRLFFSALKAPNTAGGETALADFRQVYRDLPEALRQRLSEKKLMYTRVHYKKGARFTTDVCAMKSWSEVFNTTDKAEVERISAAEGLPMRWQGPNNDTFVSQYVSEPFQLHPDTKEPVWFNHAQVFHWTTFSAELFYAWRRTKEWRFLLRSITAGLRSFVEYGLFRRKMALHITYGDGTALSLWDMHQIRRAIHKNMVFSRWQKDDLLMIDNFSTSHGRQPTYDSGRKVVVAWSDPVAKANELVFG